MRECRFCHQNSVDTEGICNNTRCMAHGDTILEKLDEEDKFCEECGGSGFIAKLYPQGHCEARCEQCEGTGLKEEA